MLVGMGTVVVFLTILVIGMSVMSAILKKFAPSTGDANDEEIAAITAAIDHHRKNTTN